MTRKVEVVVQKPIEDISVTIARMFKGKSWADIEYEIEEEEAKANYLRDAARKALWLKQEYELEDGEIFG